LAQQTEDSLAELTEKQSKQIEILIKSNNEAMEKLTAALLANKPASSTNNSASGTNKRKKGRKPGKKRKECPTCPHCDRKHPNRTADQCWELPTNADKRPDGWKSVKST
jgi:hypothetical protein